MNSPQGRRVNPSRLCRFRCHPNSSGIEANIVRDWDLDNCCKQWDSVPGHHILKNLATARNKRFSVARTIREHRQPMFASSHFGCSINFQISRAVPLVLAICSRASFAYRSVILIFEWPRILDELVKIAVLHHVPGRKCVPQIMKRKSSIFALSSRSSKLRSRRCRLWSAKNNSTLRISTIRAIGSDVKLTLWIGRIADVT